MNFKLNRPWSECEEMYNRCYMADPSRPEALYFIGIHYYLEGGTPNIKIAYELNFNVKKLILVFSAEQL